MVKSSLRFFSLSLGRTPYYLINSSYRRIQLSSLNMPKLLQAIFYHFLHNRCEPDFSLNMVIGHCEFYILLYDYMYISTSSSLSPSYYALFIPSMLHFTYHHPLRAFTTRIFWLILLLFSYSPILHLIRKANQTQIFVTWYCMSCSSSEI